MTSGSLTGRPRVRRVAARSAAPGHVVLIAAVLLLWQLVYQIAGDTAFASPVQTARALGSNVGDWLPDLKSTLVTLAISLLVTAVAGVFVGFLIGLSAFWTDVFRPILLTIYSIPKIAIYPVFLIIFKVSTTTLVTFAVFHGILPVIIMVMEGVRSVPAIQLKLARVYNLSLPRTFWHVLLPALAPVVAEAVRVGASLTFLGLVIAEMFGSSRGMGYRLVAYLNIGQVDRILAVFVVISAVGIVVSVLLLWWQRSVQSRSGALSGESHQPH